MTADRDRRRGSGASLVVGEWTVRPTLGELRSSGKVVHVEPKTMAVLLHLAERPKEVCSRESLLRAVWGDAFVTEEVLTHVVWELRRLLGDDAKQPKYIQTVPKQGYRLLAELGAPYPVSVRSVGGGAHNPAWTLIREQALGIPVHTATHQDAAYGAALLARQGAMQ